MAEALQVRSEIVRPWMTTATGTAMVDAVGDLPPRIRRWRWSTRGFGERTYTIEQYHALDAEDQRLLDFVGIHELLYYAGWNADAPFIEFRAYDLAVTGTPLAEPSALAGARILLVDPGVVTHAWLLARHGADVTIVSNRQRFRAIYDSPSDQGRVNGLDGGPDGSVTILDTNWPADEDDLGEPFDLILGVNALSMGRVEPVPSQFRHRAPTTIDKPLGATPEEAAARIAGALAISGRAVLYNWGMPARANNDLAQSGDVRPVIGPEAARAAGLTPLAMASDASQFNAMLGTREQVDEFRRPLDREGLTAPQLSVVYAVYERSEAEN